MDPSAATILGADRFARITAADTLDAAMDAAGLFEHYTSGTQSLFWLPELSGGISLAAIEALPASRGWTVWMQPRALGLTEEREWVFGDHGAAVAWMACAVLVGLKRAPKVI